MAQTDDDANTWKWMPEWLKNTVEILKRWHFVTLVIGESLAYFLGTFRGKFAGYTIGIGLFLVWSLFQRVQVRWNEVQAAIAILTSETHKDDPAYRKAATGLRQAQREGIQAYFLFLLAFIAVVCLAASPVWHWANKGKPKSIGFAEFQYYQPKEEEHPWEKAPFVEGLITYLKKEGQAVGDPFQIALGETRPLEHYTPAFQCTMKIDKGRYEATGYAFRLHEDGGRTFYEPIPAEYPTLGTVVFKVPPSQTGDRMYIVARITSLEDARFPDNLVQDATLQVIDPEK